MKKLSFPQKTVNSLYQISEFKKGSPETTTTTSQGDPTNTCTSILTTTHFVQR
jgi:hypothetical protein